MKPEEDPKKNNETNNKGRRTNKNKQPPPKKTIVTVQKMLKMKVLGNGEYPKSMNIPSPDDGLGYIDEIRVQTIESMKRTGMHLDVIKSFNKDNQYYQCFGFQSSDELSTEAIEAGLDEHTLVLGACEVHIGTYRLRL